MLDAQLSSLLQGNITKPLRVECGGTSIGYTWTEVPDATATSVANPVRLRAPLPSRYGTAGTGEAIRGGVGHHTHSTGTSTVFVAAVFSLVAIEWLSSRECRVRLTDKLGLDWMPNGTRTGEFVLSGHLGGGVHELLVRDVLDYRLHESGVMVRAKHEREALLISNDSFVQKPVESKPGAGKWLRPNRWRSAEYLRTATGTAVVLGGIWSLLVWLILRKQGKKMKQEGAQ